MRSATGPSGRKYFHNGDFSGDVVAYIPNGSVTYDSGFETCEASIPMDDILFLAALRVRSALVERAESASDREILGLD